MFLYIATIHVVNFLHMARIHVLYYSILFIPYYLALNHITFRSIYLSLLADLFSYKTISTNTLGVYKRHLDVSKLYSKEHENHFPKQGLTSLIF